MKKYSDFKQLNFKNLKGISEEAISIHYSNLYGGYVKKWQEIQEKLHEADKESANASFSELRELKLEETFTANAVLLHEAYFDILGGEDTGNPKGEIIKAIEDNFSSFEGWLREFKASGLCARGWVVLVYDFNDGKMYNYLMDWHSQGAIWGTVPLIVLDVYEHAYFIDYGSDRKKYIDDFFSNLNWDKINSKYLKIINK